MFFHFHLYEVFGLLSPSLGPVALLLVWCPSLVGLFKLEFNVFFFPWTSHGHITGLPHDFLNFFLTYFNKVVTAPFATHVKFLVVRNVFPLVVVLICFPLVSLFMRVIKLMAL